MSDNQAPASGSKICGICNQNVIKYCCPRCEIYYCSLDCYKSEKHMTCSESFYRDCVTEELASGHKDDESKRKMMEMLQRMHNDDNLEFDYNEDEEASNYDSDDNDGLDLHERVKDLNLDDPNEVWNALTEDERNEFEALLNQGDVGSIVPQWDPWWKYSKDARLVQELASKEEKEALEKCPEIIELPDLSSLTSIKPSPSVSYNITNVLASYAFIMRYFNGELEPLEGAPYILEICANLNSNINFEDPAMAIESVIQKCLQSTMIETDKASLAVMKRDTFSLLQGPSEEYKLHYCLSALSHLHTVFTQARSAIKLLKIEQKPNRLPKIDTKNLPRPNIKLPADENCSKTQSDIKKTFSKKFPDNKGDYLPKLDTSKLKKCIKKVEFYISFVRTCGLDFE